MQNIWERIFRSANFIVPGMILYVNQFYHKEQLDSCSSDVTSSLYELQMCTPSQFISISVPPSPVLGRTGFLDPIDVLPAPMVRMQFVCPQKDHRWDVNFEEIGPSGKSLGHWYV